MSGYEDDLLLWSERQGALLRRMAAGEHVNDEVDWDNIAEEVEALGRCERRELQNRIATILLHLIKLETSPAEAPRPGWRETVIEQRDHVQVILQESPSLRAALPSIIAAKLITARRLALVSLAGHRETPRIDPASLAYTEDQVIGDWLPD